MEQVRLNGAQQVGEQKKATSNNNNNKGYIKP
jgi:hypothetical protein